MAPLPLAAVTAVLHGRPHVSAIAHISATISAFLDLSVEIPLARACQVGSLALLDRIWESSDPALQTTNNSQGWSLCKFLRSDRHYYKSQFADSLNIAVTCGDLDVVVWLFQHFQGCSASTDLVEMAAFAGHLHILKYLWENGRCAQVNSDIPYEGDPRNVVFWGGNDMRMAAKRGHGDIARWLYEHVRGVERDLNRVMVYTVRKGDVELVQWLLSNVYCDVPHLPPPTINDATRTGHLHMVQWLFDHGFVEHVGDAFRNASMSNYFSIVKWLVEHGILENVDEGVQGASACGFFSIVIWLLERNLGRGAFRSMFLASMNGYVEVAQYVHAKGITDYGDNTMHMAAERGHLNVVMWLHLMFSNNADVDLFPICRPDADGYPRYSTAMDAAASNGHLDVLQFLHSVGMSTESSPERRKRKRSRDRGTLRRSRAPTCTRAAMTNAAAEGHLEVVMWLHANRTEGCVVKKTPRPAAAYR